MAVCTHFMHAHLQKYAHSQAYMLFSFCKNQGQMNEIGLGLFWFFFDLF